MGYDFGGILGKFGKSLSGGMSGGQIAPIVKAEVLSKCIEGVGIWQAIVPNLSPNSFESDVANRYSGLVADQLAKLEEVLIGPGIAVAPAGLVFKHLLNLPDQAFVSLHALGMKVCKNNRIRLPTRFCTNLYQRVQGLGCRFRAFGSIL